MTISSLSILTLIILVIYSIITTFLPASMKVASIFYIVITLVSVLYGSVFAAKKVGEVLSVHVIPRPHEDTEKLYSSQE